MFVVPDVQPGADTKIDNGMPFGDLCDKAVIATSLNHLCYYSLWNENLGSRHESERLKDCCLRLGLVHEVTQLLVLSDSNMGLKFIAHSLVG